MRWYRNMKISAKLITAFLAIAILAAGVGIFGIVTLKAINTSSAEIFENYGNSQGYLGYVYGEFERQRAYMKDILVDKDESKAMSIQKLILASNSRMTKYMGKYGETCISLGTTDRYNSLHEKIARYQRLVRDVAGAGATGNFVEAYTISHSDEATEIVNDATAAIEAAIAVNEEEAAVKLSEQNL